jgi:hypothetical protein
MHGPASSATHHGGGGPGGSMPDFSTPPPGWATGAAGAGPVGMNAQVPPGMHVRMQVHAPRMPTHNLGPANNAGTALLQQPGQQQQPQQPQGFNNAPHFQYVPPPVVGVAHPPQPPPGLIQTPTHMHDRNQASLTGPSHFGGGGVGGFGGQQQNQFRLNQTPGQMIQPQQPVPTSLGPAWEKPT